LAMILIFVADMVRDLRGSFDFKNLQIDIVSYWVLWHWLQSGTWVLLGGTVYLFIICFWGM